jgi:hypothetical protein
VWWGCFILWILGLVGGFDPLCGAVVVFLYLISCTFKKKLLSGFWLVENVCVWFMIFGSMVGWIWGFGALFLLIFFFGWAIFLYVVFM